MADSTNETFHLTVPRTAAELISSRPSLPAGRAFVVQFNQSSAIATGQFAGRVEHVSSGRQRRFDSLPDLAAFISEVVRDSGEVINGAHKAP